MMQYPEATEKLIIEMRAACDTLAYSNDDFLALERVLYTIPRQLFDKETVTRKRALCASRFCLFGPRCATGSQKATCPRSPRSF